MRTDSKKPAHTAHRVTEAAAQSQSNRPPASPDIRPLSVQHDLVRVQRPA